MLILKMKGIYDNISSRQQIKEYGSIIMYDSDVMYHKFSKGETINNNMRYKKSWLKI